MPALTELAENYRQKYGWSQTAYRSELAKSAIAFIRADAMALGDSIAVAVALESLMSFSEVHLDQLSDSALEAFHTAFPHVAIGSLQYASQQQLEGMLSAWKGKLFEIDVRDRLNEGEWVGDWHLESGQVAHLAESPTQEGWDLIITNDDGTTADLIQLKATASAEYVQAALDRYPDIDVLTTNDVSGHFEHLGNVSSDVVSVHDVSDQITDAVPIDDAADHVSDGLGMMTPASFIAITEGFKVMTGQKSVGQAIGSGGQRMALSGIAAAAGGIAAFFTGGTVGALVAIVTRLYLGAKVGAHEKNRLSTARPKAQPKQLTSHGTTIDGQSRRVRERLELASRPKRRARPGAFRRLEDSVAYLARKYDPASGRKSVKPRRVGSGLGKTTETGCPVPRIEEQSHHEVPLVSVDRPVDRPIDSGNKERDLFVGQNLRHVSLGTGTIVRLDKRYAMIRFLGESEPRKYQRNTCLDPAWFALLTDGTG